MWLVTGRAGSDLPRLEYEAAIEEALCFGWIDGQSGTVDSRRSKLYFVPRRAGSPWSRYNKARVERVVAAGSMTAAGLAVIERAKADGSWSVFDSVDRLELPVELKRALAGQPSARANWDAWPESVRRQVLASIALAKRPETRARRMAKAAEMAARNERPGP
ncbi:YdeI/OmpD-associated family protein [soil metagenome]